MTCLYMCQKFHRTALNTVMLSGGDLKAYLSMKQSGVYHVTKEECINYVSKHMSIRIS